MSERVWKQLTAEERMGDYDAVLRLALCAMAADRTSPLTPSQREWIIALGQRTTPFTAGERAKLKDPLLAWVTEKLPRCEAIIRKQFAEGAANGHDQSDPR
jgi:hypothetical protein